MSSVGVAVEDLSVGARRRPCAACRGRPRCRRRRRGSSRPTPARARVGVRVGARQQRPTGRSRRRPRGPASRRPGSRASSGRSRPLLAGLGQQVVGRLPRGLRDLVDQVGRPSPRRSSTPSAAAVSSGRVETASAPPSPAVTPRPVAAGSAADLELEAAVVEADRRGGALEVLERRRSSRPTAASSRPVVAERPSSRCRARRAEPVGERPRRPPGRRTSTRCRRRRPRRSTAGSRRRRPASESAASSAMSSTISWVSPTRAQSSVDRPGDVVGVAAAAVAQLRQARRRRRPRRTPGPRRPVPARRHRCRPRPRRTGRPATARCRRRSRGRRSRPRSWSCSKIHSRMSSSVSRPTSSSNAGNFLQGPQRLDLLPAARVEVDADVAERRGRQRLRRLRHRSRRTTRPPRRAPPTATAPTQRRPRAPPYAGRGPRGAGEAYRRRHGCRGTPATVGRLGRRRLGGQVGRHGGPHDRAPARAGEVAQPTQRATSSGSRRPTDGGRCRGDRPMKTSSSPISAPLGSAIHGLSPGDARAPSGAGCRRRRCGPATAGSGGPSAVPTDQHQPGRERRADDHGGQGQQRHPVGQQRDGHARRPGRRPGRRRRTSRSRRTRAAARARRRRVQLVVDDDADRRASRPTATRRRRARRPRPSAATTSTELQRGRRVACRAALIRSGIPGRGAA